MENIFDSPKIYTKKNFLSNEDCLHFINISRDNIQQSLVAGDKEGFISKGRTGKNCWIKHNHDAQKTSVLLCFLGHSKNL